MVTSFSHSRSRKISTSVRLTSSTCSPTSQLFHQAGRTLYQDNQDINSPQRLVYKAKKKKKKEFWTKFVPELSEPSSKRRKERKKRRRRRSRCPFADHQISQHDFVVVETIDLNFSLSTSHKELGPKSSFRSTRRRLGKVRRSV